MPSQARKDGCRRKPANSFMVNNTPRRNRKNGNRKKSSDRKHQKSKEIFGDQGGNFIRAYPIELVIDLFN